MYEDDEDEVLHGLPARASNRLRRREQKHQRPRKKNKTTVTQTAARDAPTVGGVVIGAWGGAASVFVGEPEPLSCVIDAQLRRRSGAALAVGDEVTVARDPSGVDLVVRVSPRRSTLARRSTQNIHAEQVLVANVDAVVIVAAASEPPFRPRLVDRYLVAIRRGGARPVLLINKLDEADEARRAELAELTAPYVDVGVPVHMVSAGSGEGLEALLQELADERCAFVGHSGVGKSTLVSALGSEAVTGELAEHGRGRHTTSTATLHRLPGGVEVIDTPGIRQFGLLGLTRQELGEAFPELAHRAPECRYVSCTHTGEDSCAVRAALDRGEIAPARYDSYVRLLAHTSD